MRSNGRSSIQFTCLLTLLLLLIAALLASTSNLPSRPSASLAQSPLSLRFSDIIAKRVRVVVDPIRVFAENGTFEKGMKKPVCVVALHRDECQGPKIRSNERIGWKDRICFVWRCLRDEGLAWRVQDCWAGSPQSPILLIDRDGCTREGSMPANHSAQSLGGLTVRLPHLDHIRFSCAIKFCRLCDSECRIQTPPTKCDDLEAKEETGDEWWQRKMESSDGKNLLKEFCDEEREQQRGEQSNSLSAWTQARTWQKEFLYITLTFLTSWFLAQFVK